MVDKKLSPLVILIKMNITINKNILFHIFILSLLALVGNYASYPLFYSVSFIFGSIATIYAAISMGRFAAVFVSFIGSIYTFYLWGHPYAIIIFVAEAFWVATFINRFSFHVVLIDVTYWLLLGIPLVFLFYTQFIGLPLNAAALISLKQSLNGIFNALLASFIFFAANVFWSKKQHLSIQPLLFNIILLITLLSGSIPTLMSTHQTSINYEQQIQDELKIISTQIHNQLISSNIQTLDDFKSAFKTISYLENISVAILNKENTYIYKHGELKSLQKNKNSEIVTRDNGITIWLPNPNMPAMKRWQQGKYLYGININNIPTINKIIVEKNASNVVAKVNNLKTKLFSILSLLMAIAILTAFILSRWLTQPIYNLNKIGQELNNNITSGETISLPTSSISEYSNLAQTLQKMAAEISANYHSLNAEKDNLAAIVDKNTETLKRLSMVASRTTNSVIITDTEGRTEWINDAFENLTGYKINEILNKKPGGFLQGPETDKDTVAKISTCLKHKQNFSEDLINYKKSGEPYWIHIDCDPIFDGNKLSGFISIESDITQRKQAEEILKSRTAQLNAVLNAATEISVITTDVNGLITLFNSGAEKMLGYQASEFINKESPAKIHLQAEVTLRGHELSRQLGYEVSGFNTFIAIPDIKGSETREWTYVKKDGSHIIVLLSVTAIMSNSNETIGYLGVAQDITERKRLENMKKEFVSTVSHELRTPLTSINGTLGLINGGAVGEVSPEAQQMLEVAIENSKRLTTLINDLLDMEKIASGKMDFNLESQFLMPLIEKSLQTNSAYAEQYNVTYKLLSRCNKAQVNIDPNRFLQIMANFLSNAAKFSHAGDSVNINVECNSNTVKISIQDYGLGIDKEFFEQIFTKFSQADSSDTRAKGGTGLGLAITQELITYMHGTVGFDSKKGKGSIFWFKLPLIHQ